MSNWTNETKNSTTWTNTDKALSIDAGMPIGLLLSLTYALNSDNITWTNETKNSATWSNQLKN